MYQQVMGTASDVSATVVATDPLPQQQRLAARSLLTNDHGQVLTTLALLIVILIPTALLGRQHSLLPCAPRALISYCLHFCTGWCRHPC